MSISTSEMLIGSRCTVAILGDTVEKQTRDSFDQVAAEQLASDLTIYADQLERSPLRVAPLLDTAIDTLSDGQYVVRHRQPFIAGAALAEARPEVRVAATRQILGEIANMPTFGRKGLATPIDAWAGNFRVDSREKAHFVDFMPPMVRRPDGSFPAPAVTSFDRIAVSSPAFVMARLLRSVAAPHGDTPYDMLPDALRGRQRDVVRTLIAADYLPYRLSRRLVHKTLGVFPESGF